MPVCYSFYLNTTIYVFIRMLNLILISVLVISPLSDIVCWFLYHITLFIYFCSCICVCLCVGMHVGIGDIYMYTHNTHTHTHTHIYIYIYIYIYIKCVVSFQVKVYWNLRSYRCYHLILHENVCQ